MMTGMRDTVDESGLATENIATQQKQQLPVVVEGGGTAREASEARAGARAGARQFCGSQEPHTQLAARIRTDYAAWTQRTLPVGA